MRGNFGFIHEKIDIKILILYILRRIPASVTFDELTGLVMCDEGISYFDFTECIAELIKTKHIRHKDNKYSLTVKGAHNGEITEKSLPYTVRCKVDDITSNFRSMLGRDEMITTQYTVNPDGSCTVALSLSDGLGDVVSMSLYSVNEKQALALEKGFRKKAENIYMTLIEAILD